MTRITQERFARCVLLATPTEKRPRCMSIGRIFSKEAAKVYFSRWWPKEFFKGTNSGEVLFYRLRKKIFPLKR